MKATAGQIGFANWAGPNLGVVGPAMAWLNYTSCARTDFSLHIATLHTKFSSSRPSRVPCYQSKLVKTRFFDWMM